MKIFLILFMSILLNSSLLDQIN
ncbi:hypothetical protein, partial [Campylobacter coli]